MVSSANWVKILAAIIRETVKHPSENSEISREGEVVQAGVSSSNSDEEDEQS